MVLVMMLAGMFAIPAPGADDPPPITRKDLQDSSNNLKQIGLAIINSADSNRGLMPTDITDKDGKALLSWRVAILPQLGEQKLYDQFHQDEPWDSPHNRALLKQIPKVFTPAEEDSSKVRAVGMTSMLRPVGPGTLFDPAVEEFTVFEIPTAGAAVRQILGRPGEIWGAESATDKLIVIRLD
jgi:hypothetical protein